MNPLRMGLLVVVICLSAFLVLLIFVPVVPSPGGAYNACDMHGCVAATQYESLSYEYGGTGALFRTGLNWYSVQPVICMCPLEIPGQPAPCCALPLEGAFWLSAGSLFVADIAAVVVLARR
jgi:hypothetical protein